MSKEEVLKNNRRGFDRSDHKSILAAMDEYAKQQAIAFDVWKRENCYTIDPSGEWYIKLIIEGDSARTETVLVDDVYSRFIDEQEK